MCGQCGRACVAKDVWPECFAQPPLGLSKLNSPWPDMLGVHGPHVTSGCCSQVAPIPLFSLRFSGAICILQSFHLFMRGPCFEGDEHARIVVIATRSCVWNSLLRGSKRAVVEAAAMLRLCHGRAL